METIVALSSGLPAAIAIVRLSGEKALSLAQSLITSREELAHKRLIFGTIKAGNITDTITAVYYKAPKSYTGEDMVEIFCHGNSVVVTAIIEELIKNGAVAARNGEFTMRGFLSGKMDLSEAEGVISLINSRSEGEAIASFRQLSGELRQKIEQFSRRLLRIIAQIEADLDYPEEDIAAQNSMNISENIAGLASQIEALRDTYSEGRLIKEGVRVVLSGNVNVGKSSIINALLGKNRAIVSDIAGTTRDIIEDSYTYKGKRFILVDTAGIRESGDKIESIGIEMAKNEQKNADIVVEIADNDSDFLKKLEKNGKNIRTIYVYNKCDLFSPPQNDNQIAISAKTGKNIGDLKEKIYTTAYNQQRESDSFILTDIRHHNCLSLCYNNLHSAQDGIKNAVSGDCIAADLRAALFALSQITSISGNEAIIEEIFANFCVGK